MISRPKISLFVNCDVDFYIINQLNNSYEKKS